MGLHSSNIIILLQKIIPFIKCLRKSELTFSFLLFSSSPLSLSLPHLFSYAGHLVGLFSVEKFWGKLLGSL